MGRPKGNGTTVTRTRKSPQEAQAAIVARVRKVIGKATAQLQAAQIRQSGRPGGNPELIKAYEQFDNALGALGNVAPAAK